MSVCSLIALLAVPVSALMAGSAGAAVSLSDAVIVDSPGLHQEATLEEGGSERFDALVPIPEGPLAAPLPAFSPGLLLTEPQTGAISDVILLDLVVVDNATFWHIAFLSDTEGAQFPPPGLPVANFPRIEETGSFQDVTSFLFPAAGVPAPFTLQVLSDVEPVPEPGVWVLMVGGFALLGFQLARRRER